MTGARAPGLHGHLLVDEAARPGGKPRKAAAAVIRVEFRHRWCPPCDDKRITRIETGFRAIAAAFEEAKA